MPFIPGKVALITGGASGIGLAYGIELFKNGLKNSTSFAFGGSTKMGFINGKVALITGGASGIGFMYGKELFKNALRGLVIADIDPVKGKEAVDLITKEFGPNRVTFIKTDVTVQKEVEAAFQKAIDTFKNLDIVINNAGVLNDAIWEKQIAININGTVYGNILGFDKYLPKYKTGSEAVIVNIASITGLTHFPCIPVYAATKHAIIGLSRSYGVPEHYARTKVRVLTICPGVTDTPLISESNKKNLGPEYEKLLPQLLQWPKQQPDNVAKALIKAIEEGPNGSFWLANAGKFKQIEIPSLVSPTMTM